jgi:FAD/FMN-containing dehydrogenase
MGKILQDQHTTAVSSAELETALEGPLIRPDDAAYEEARQVWNGMIDRRPALIARATSVEDVVAAVNFARENGMLLSVRGGGHNVAGHGTNDGGLVIDLSLMNRVVVDPETRLVRAGGGTSIGHLDAATQAHGLAVPMGVVSATGIAGLTLGGGYGWLRNKYGLSCDNLVEAEVVTTDGQVIRASASENADLLWGLRGGGGNFGIVTEFVYQAHPVGPEVMFAFVFHDGRGDNVKRAIQFYRDYSATAPDEVSSLLFTGRIPPDEGHFPAEIHNVPYVTFAAMYVGEPQQGRAVLQPLRNFGQDRGIDPLLDFSDVMPYVEAQQILDEEYPNGLRYYWKSLNLTRLDEEVIDRIVKHARRQPSALSTVDLWYIGGAVRRTGADESAFHGREATFLLSPEANWESMEGDEANVTWLREFVADMEEFSDGSRYLNFAGFQEEGDEMMQRAFGPQYRRLAALKRKYDPDNLFRLNQNVRPEAE